MKSLAILFFTNIEDYKYISLINIQLNTMAQKVITVNINVYEQSVTNRHSAYEISFVNKYLDDGWVIKEIIHSATAAANWTNITFVLEK